MVKSLNEKIADLVLAIGIVGVLGSSVSVASVSTRDSYPTLNEETTIVKELENIGTKKFLAGNDEVVTKYSEYHSIYSKNLEEKLQSVRASPQYAAETQQKDADTRNATLSFFGFLLLGIGAGIYGTKEERKRITIEKAQTTTGAPQ